MVLEKSPGYIVFDIDADLSTLKRHIVAEGHNRLICRITHY